MDLSKDLESNIKLLKDFQKLVINDSNDDDNKDNELTD